MTPGTYLQLRREAAGLSLDDVAAKLETQPRLAAHVRANWLRLIENDTCGASFTTIVAIRQIVPFDIAALERLALIDLGADLPPPPICRICGDRAEIHVDDLPLCLGCDDGFVA